MYRSSSVPFYLERKPEPSQAESEWACFDLLSGWTLWAPFTLIIVGIMGFTVGKITEDHKHQNMKWYVIAIAAACVIKVVGYYIAEVIIYGNPLAPVSSIPGNLVQIGVAAVIVLVVITPLNLAKQEKPD